MKVCIICPSVYPLLNPDCGAKISGGAEAQFKVIGQTLAARDYDVSYVVDDFGQDDFETRDNVKIHKSPLRYLGASNKYLPADWRYLWATLREIDADVYILKLPRHLLLPVGLYTKLHGKKLIFVGQIDQDADPEFIRQADGLIAAKMYQAGLKLVDHIIAQNRIQKENFAINIGRSATIIKNTLTLESAKDLNKQDYILWVGNSLAKKQPHVFLDLAEALPQYRFRMIMAPSHGGEHASVEERVKNIANVDYRGFVPLNEIASHYAGARIYVSTSKREGFPNTFLQSWQHRTPVISLHVDPDDVLTEFQNGCLAGDFKTLQKQVDQALQSADALKAMADAGEKYIHANHDKEQITDRYEDIFSKIAPSVPRPTSGRLKHQR